MDSTREVSFYTSVYVMVQEIPPGKVATYGQIAAMLGSPRAARAVGYALAALSEARAQVVPWQRVINAQGFISARGDVIRAELQQRLLEAEGIRFSNEGRVALSEFLWEGPQLGGFKPPA